MKKLLAFITVLLAFLAGVVPSYANYPQAGQSAVLANSVTSQDLTMAYVATALLVFAIILAIIALVATPMGRAFFSVLGSIIDEESGEGSAKQ